MSIDSSARIDSKAEIDSDVTIGPWTIVGPNVQIASGTVIDSHVMIRANTKIGKNNRIFQFSSVGEDPADNQNFDCHCVLELHDPLVGKDILVDGRREPLETDLTTPLAYFLDNPDS